MQDATFVSAVLTFADGSTVTVVPQGTAPVPAVQPTDTEVTLTLSDGTTKVFVPRA